MVAHSEVGGVQLLLGGDGARGKRGDGHGDGAGGCLGGSDEAIAEGVGLEG